MLLLSVSEMTVATDDVDDVAVAVVAVVGAVVGAAVLISEMSVQ